MKILISGHCGYIGPILTKICHQHNHEVVGLDTFFYKELSSNIDSQYLPDKEYKMDIRDLNINPFLGVDGVIHLAALSNDPIGDVATSQTKSINTLGTVYCAKFAKKAGVKTFVFSSSCSIYGASENNSLPLDENAKINPVSAYALSKIEAENELLKLRSDSFSTIMMRNATAYGVSPRMRLDLVLNNLMAVGYTTGIIKVLSDGTPWRPLVHIEDISKAAISAITAQNKIPHSIYNIGSKNCNYTVKEIAQIVANNLDNCEVNITGENGNDPRSYKVDFSRALNSLPGYKPTWNLDKGAKEMKKWLSENLKTNENINSNKYIRLLQLKKLLQEKKIDKAFRWTY